MPAKKDETKKRCFVVTALGPDGGDVRKHANQMLEYVLEPVLAERGYEVTRSDRIAHPGPIDTQIVTHLLEDELVIADLSIDNTNVYYELAARHATKKPVVHLMRPGQDIPFDVRQLRCVPVDLHDLDSVKGAKKSIGEQIKSLEKNPEVESPLSLGSNFSALRQSGDPQAQAYTKVIQVLENMMARIDAIERRESTRAFAMTGPPLYPWGGGLVLGPSNVGVADSASFSTVRGLSTTSIPGAPSPIKGGLLLDDHEESEGQR